MVQDILSRHCSSDITLTDHERFVTHQLHVSTELVYEAKVITNVITCIIVLVLPFQALRSRYDGKVKEQVWNLIKAQQWNASHEVIMSQLAARAIVNGEQPLLSVTTSSYIITGHTETLRKMLSCLVEDDHSNYIMDWDHQGSVCLFVCVCARKVKAPNSQIIPYVSIVV